MNPLRRLRLFRTRASAWLLNRRNEGAYETVGEGKLRECRSSDTVFIFGSGYSVNDISNEEWQHIQCHDTFSFNWFIRQDFAPMDFHLIREVGAGYDDLEWGDWEKPLIEYTDLLRDNPNYQDTVFLVQEGWMATAGNRMIGLGLLPPDNLVCRFQNVREARLPTSSLREGLVHAAGTLTDCVNLAYILGWTDIVLVGVDLYDRRYFWLDYDETRHLDRRRGASHRDKHNTADPVVEIMGDWNEAMQREGVQLYSWNPKSLLTEVLPVYEASKRESA